MKSKRKAARKSGTARPQPARRGESAPGGTARPKITKRRIAVLIADDHSVVREGLVSLIRHKPDMTVVAEAAHGVLKAQTWRKGGDLHAVERAVRR